MKPLVIIGFLSFLNKLGFKITVFNPLQSDALRNFYIRITKTDTKDAYLIAQVIRIDSPDETPFIEEDLLLHSPLPEDLLEIESEKLAFFLNQASSGRFGESKALSKANKLHDCTLNTFGIDIATDVFKLQIKLLLEQINLLEQHLEKIESQMIEISNHQKHYLMTITGISDVTACVILGEIGSIKRFKRPEQLVAYAGLDPSVHQSGDFNGSKTRISKRGSPYLRRAIWQAAFVASFYDPALSLHYQKLRKRDKSHGTAICAAAHKLLHTIFAILRDNKPYHPRFNTNIPN